MSYNVYLGVGKFVIHGAEIPNKQFENFINDPERYTIELPEYENDEEYPINKFSINNWIWTDCGFEIKQCHANVWQKDNYKIFTVNEHKFANGSEYCLAIVADDKDSLLEFIKDFNIQNFTIEENDPIQQWC